MRKVLLTVIYYLLFVPVASVVRLFRGDPLDRAWDAERASYWIFTGDVRAVPAEIEAPGEDAAEAPDRQPAPARPS